MSGDISERQKRIFGDYQTPLDFCRQVCSYLDRSVGFRPRVIFEPTCGEGNFLVAAAQTWVPSCVDTVCTSQIRFVGLELSEAYLELARSRLASMVSQTGSKGRNGISLEWIQADFFSADLSRIRGVDAEEPLLVIGNPPWVMNGTLTSLNAKNPVSRSNFQQMRGIDAITGASSFDLCESVILKIIETFHRTNTLVAMLCKTSVARKVFQELSRRHTSVSWFRIVRVDSHKIFGITAAACLFLIQLATSGDCAASCEVYRFERPEQRVSTFGFRDQRFYASLECAERWDTALDGTCCFEWRQGIKHDCASVMELERNGSLYQNGRDESYPLEDDYIYPLMKGSDFRLPMIDTFRKWLIVTQQKVGDSTDEISRLAPITWAYLCAHRELFERRKSVIYRQAPPFSIFGVGNYSFAPFKVGVSGFYKTPFFSLLTSHKPVMLDDTGYFLAFDRYDDAYMAMLVLNSSPVQEFLQSIAFSDAKRPWTKKILSRINMSQAVRLLPLSELEEIEKTLGLEPRLNVEVRDHFVRLINGEKTDSDG